MHFQKKKKNIGSQSKGGLFALERYNLVLAITRVGENIQIILEGKINSHKVGNFIIANFYNKKLVTVVLNG